MALGALVQDRRQGHTTMRPNGISRVTIVGDDDYTTGGTVDFVAAFLRAELNRDLEVTQVVGYGLVAGVITHIVSYDTTDDKLLVYLLADGIEVANAVDLSTSTFDLEIHYS